MDPSECKLGKNGPENSGDGTRQNRAFDLCSSIERAHKVKLGKKKGGFGLKTKNMAANRDPDLFLPGSVVMS